MNKLGDWLSQTRRSENSQIAFEVVSAIQLAIPAIKEKFFLFPVSFFLLAGIS